MSSRAPPPPSATTSPTDQRPTQQPTVDDVNRPGDRPTGQPADDDYGATVVDDRGGGGSVQANIITYTLVVVAVVDVVAVVQRVFPATATTS